MQYKSIQSIRLTKSKIRSKILFKLKTQKEEERNQKSSLIKAKLFKINVFKKAKTIMFYVSFGGEVDTKEMIKEAQRLGKIVTVPICNYKKNRMIRPAILSDKAKLIKGPYGIYEPAFKRHINLKDLDLVIVPGLAFDKKGNRLGRGKGYYDRFLRKLSPKIFTIGLAFDFQILPSVPTTPKDIAVKKVIFA